jgi:hypothetical protein
MHKNSPSGSFRLAGSINFYLCIIDLLVHIISGSADFYVKISDMTSNSSTVAMFVMAMCMLLEMVHANLCLCDLCPHWPDKCNSVVLNYRHQTKR